MDHLHPKVVELVDKPIKDRINFINSQKWIGYTAAEQILVAMEGLMEYPKSSRMPGMLIVGETHNGKTALLEQFIKQHPISRDDREEGINLPVVKVQAPPIPDEKKLYNNIMDSLNLPYRVNDKIEQKHRQIVHVMKETNVKLLLIDEIHHVLAGSPTKQRIFLNIIKYLANDLCISIVCAGTKDAMAAIGIEPQLANRFEPFGLPKWKLDNEYLKLLASFERIMPLKFRSNLYNKDLSATILSMSEGYLGEISDIIKRATIEAVKNGTEKVTVETLGQIRFLSPSIRRRADLI